MLLLQVCCINLILEIELTTVHYLASQSHQCDQHSKEPPLDSFGGNAPRLQQVCSGRAPRVPDMSPASSSAPLLSSSCLATPHGFPPPRAPRAPFRTPLESSRA